MTHTKTKQQPKLSVIRKGVWRNKWHSILPIDFIGIGVTPPGTYVGWRTFPSEKAARDDAEDWKRKYAGEPDADACFYLGPVFFPEEGEQ